jgi:hypothetical protein
VTSGNKMDRFFLDGSILTNEKKRLNLDFKTKGKKERDEIKI